MSTAFNEDKFRVESPKPSRDRIVERSRYYGVSLLGTVRICIFLYTGYALLMRREPSNIAVLRDESR